MIHYFFVGAIETFQLFAQHVKLNARETRCKHQPFKNPKWTKASACNLKANSIQRVSQNLMKLFEDKSNQCKNVVPLESQDKRHTSILPYMAFYWYALFHRKKAIPITFREQVFYRDIGNVARENSGKKGPISYFCLGNVPQSTPPSKIAFDRTTGRSVNL